LYAALELRFGIEARLQELLEAQRHISEKKKKGWQIAKLSKNLKKAFRGGDRVTEIEITDPQSGESLAKFFYTPVSPKLEKMGQKLGDLLHAMKKVRNDDDPWWEKTRRYLEQIADELARATAGTLLGPPLRKKGSDRVDLTTEIVDGTDAHESIRVLKHAGKQLIFGVKRHKGFPDELQVGATFEGRNRSDHPVDE